MSLNYLRVQNLRSLGDTGPIDIKPLTILVGTNSSGKSTFLRTFPLLRQSVETPTTGPILWYGRYVDFGTFNQAVRRNASPQEVTFEFGLTIQKNYDPNNVGYPYWRGSNSFLDDLDVIIALTLGQYGEEQKTLAKSIVITVGEEKLTIQGNETGEITALHVNNTDYSNYAKKARLIPSDNVLPVIAPNAPGSRLSPHMIRRIAWAGPFEDVLAEAFLPLFAKQTGSAKRLQIAHAIGLGHPVSQLRQLQSMDAGNVFARKTAHLRSHDRAFKRIREALLLAALPNLLREADTLLASNFRRVQYIAPVRATAERYYRQQDLSINEVDPQGTNLAMFLQSLTWTDKSAFSNWCMEQLGFSVRAKTEGSHISLVLGDVGTEAEYNIADMGFGFSQILPILAQIWNTTRTGRSNPSLVAPNALRTIDTSGKSRDIIAIEQPELHLHPRLQARVADMFVSAGKLAKGANKPFAIVFETHSETMINRIGHLVASGHLSASDVQILLFEKEAANSDTKVRKAVYNDDGILQNWPFGFFLATADEEGELTLPTSVENL